ncbi:MAG: hypothetical protein C6W54_13390 [Bacillaceae bacterium]|nr:MAG: hypothetical protein C6W54_13390 [Bacillaceae bacterium]
MLHFFKKPAANLEMVGLKRITERISVILWKSALRYSSRFHTQSSVFVHEHSKRRNQRNNAFHVEKMNLPMSAAVLLLTRSTINVFFIIFDCISQQLI